MTNKDASIIIGNIPIKGDDCYTIAEYQEAKARAIQALEQQPCEDTEVIKVSKGAVKARQGRFVIYDVEWLKENFYTTEEKIYGQPKQPCEDCISREAVQDLISRWLSDYLLDETREALETINYKVGDMPSVTPQRPKGKWIDIRVIKAFHYDGEPRVRCSRCENKEEWSSNYCPNCGAEMSGGVEDEAET